jgi:transposase-like protein
MFVDATFFLAPDGFYQLLIFHGVLSNGKTFVADFVLIKSKSEKNYREIFSNLKSILNSQSLLLKPDIIMVDFEKALQNALLKEFPNSKLSGCWFHFTQALRRWSIRIFSQSKVFEDYELKNWLAQYSTLALTPINLNL